MRGRNPGFTLVEIMIVVAIIGLLAAIAIPSLLRARRETQRKIIVNNLRLIEHARDQILTISNVASYASEALTFETVGVFLKPGSVWAMDWPATPDSTNEMDDAWLKAPELVVTVDLGVGPEEIRTGRGTN